MDAAGWMSNWFRIPSFHGFLVKWIFGGIVDRRHTRSAALSVPQMLKDIRLANSLWHCQQNMLRQCFREGSGYRDRQPGEEV